MCGPWTPPGRCPPRRAPAHRSPPRSRLVSPARGSLATMLHRCRSKTCELRPGGQSEACKIRFSSFSVSLNIQEFGSLIVRKIEGVKYFKYGGSKFYRACCNTTGFFMMFYFRD
jgi:hypothetical protein